MSEQATRNEISLKELFIIGIDWARYLISKWIIICLVGVIGGSLGFAYAYSRKPMYTASLSFALEDDKGNNGLSGALGLASQFGFDFGESGGGIFAGSNLIELFKSRRMVEQTLLKPFIFNGKTISFAERFIQNKNWREGWDKNPSLKGVQILPSVDRTQFTRVQDSLMGVIFGEILSSSLDISQKDKKIEIITIEMKSGDENFAKYFTESLAKEVSDFYIFTKSQRARLNMDILERQSDSIRVELNNAITGVAVENDNIFGLNPALNARRAPSSKRQVDVQANLAILTELVKQTELAKVNLRNETPLIQIIDSPIFPLKKEKFGKIKGIIIGGILASFLIVLLLILRRLIKRF